MVRIARPRTPERRTDGRRRGIQAAEAEAAQVDGRRTGAGDAVVDEQQVGLAQAEPELAVVGLQQESLAGVGIAFPLGGEAPVGGLRGGQGLAGLRAGPVVRHAGL